MCKLFLKFLVDKLKLILRKLIQKNNLLLGGNKNTRQSYCLGDAYLMIGSWRGNFELYWRVCCKKLSFPIALRVDIEFYHRTHVCRLGQWCSIGLVYVIYGTASRWSIISRLCYGQKFCWDQLRSLILRKDCRHSLRQRGIHLERCLL